jgi:hypothetical protein
VHTGAYHHTMMSNHNLGVPVSVNVSIKSANRCGIEDSRVIPRRRVLEACAHSTTTKTSNTF